MISMDFDSEHKCPDCGAMVWLPLTVTSFERGTSAWVSIREAEFRESFERHVMLNPQQHPHFVVKNEHGSCGDPAASNG